MSGTAVGIWVIVVVVVAALLVWLGLVSRAARQPQQEHPPAGPLHGLVQGAARRRRAKCRADPRCAGAGRWREPADGGGRGQGLSRRPAVPG